MNDAQNRMTNRSHNTVQRPRQKLIVPLALLVLFAGIVFFAGELLAAARYASIGGLSFADGIALWNQPLKADTSYLWWEVGVKLRIDRAISGFILFAIVSIAAWSGYKSIMRP